MTRFGRFLSKLLGNQTPTKKTCRARWQPSVILLEDRTMPSTLIQVANVDGYVADANLDGGFDTVNTTGTSVQTSLIASIGTTTDQSCSAPAYYNYNTSYSGNLPMGQEFKPNLSSLSFVDLVIADAGSDTGPGANFLVKIHSGTMAGSVLGTSATVFVADNTNQSGTTNYTHFTFASPISLTPGSTYVLEIVQTGSIVGGNSNFMLTSDNPNGANVYAAGRGIIHGTPVTTNLDFLFREGGNGQQGVTERGVMEFNTAAITSSSVITSAMLSGTVNTLQVTPAAGVVAGFYAYAGDGLITLADATASSTQVGSASISALGAFSVNLNPGVIQSLMQSAGYHGYIGLLVQLTSGQRFFLNSTESTAAGPKPTLQIVYDTNNHSPTANNDSFKINPGQSQLFVNAPGILANDTDPEGDPLTASLVTGPSYGSISFNGDGSFIYTPMPGQAFSADTFTYQASDGNSFSNIATVTIRLNHAPVAYAWYSTTTVNVPVNVAAPGVLSNDYDPDGDFMTAQLVTGPSHGTLTFNSNGSFNYVPNQDYTGADSFSYQAFDGFLTSNTAVVSLVVDTPAVAQDDSYSVNQGSVLTVNAPGILANDSDVNGDHLIAYRVASPSHGTLSLSSTGSFTYTPTAGYYGTDTFTYKDSDGYTFGNIATVTITVNHVNQAPVANADAYSVNQDTTLTVAAAGVLANDTDADGDALTASLVNGPSHGSLTLNADGSFSYTPNAGYVGSDSFTYKAGDGILNSNTATVAITVNHVNHAPVAVDNAYTINEDQTLTVSPVAGVTSLAMQSQAGDYIGQGQNRNYSSSTGVFSAIRNFDNGVSLAYQDSTNANAWWYLDFAAPANAYLTPGTFLNATRYPFQSSNAPGLNVSGEGRGSNTLTGQFTVVQAVYGANSQISRFDATFVQHSEGMTPALTGEIKYNYSTAPSGLLINDSDADGDPLSSILVTGPAHGTLTFNADGTFTYKPNANYNGADSFTYKANDGSLDSNVATVAITVNSVNDAPTFVKGANRTNVEGDGAQTIAGWASAISAGPGDEAGQTLNFAVSTSNNALFAVPPAIDPASGTLTYTPADDAVGNATVFVLLHDNGGTANGGSDTSFLQTFTITINDFVPTPLISGASTIDEGSTYTLGLSAIDPDPITKWTITWGDGAVQTVSGNPSSVTHVYADGSNTYTIRATATDEDGTYNAGNTVGVTVNNVAPTLTLSGPASANESSLYTLGLSSVDPGQDTISSWTIAWGDGSTQTINGNPSSVTHVYTPGNYTISASATDEDGTYDAGNTIALSVNAVHFTIAGSTASTAGAAFDITVTAVDPSGNTADGYFGTVHFTSSDALASLPDDYTFGPSDAGSHVFTDGVILDTAGSQTVTATDTLTSSISGSLSVAVSPAAASRFIVNTPPASTAGTSFTVTLTALDSFNNIATGYTGTIHFTSSDAQALLPADATLSDGVGSFSATLFTAGSQSITATDSSSSSVNVSSAIAVSAVAASHFSIAGTTNATAGAAFGVTVTALDPFGNIADTYLGTIHFTSSEALASVPSDYTFVAADAGTHVFAAGVTLDTAGAQTVTATDIGSATITGVCSVNVGAAEANHYQLDGPATAMAGSAFTVTVTALDPFNNVATGYSGTVHFTSSDSQAALSADSTLNGGIGSFSATLKTAGAPSITATDTSASITGSIANVAVTPAAAATLAAAGFASPTTAGVAHSITVTLRDAYGNVATGYTGTVHFASSDSTASLPADYAFSAGDAGVHAFSATLKTAGVQSITATDTAMVSLTGSQSAITVTPAAAAIVGVAGFASPTTAGVAHSITVTLRDAFGNVATDYIGTVHFTSSDNQAVLPADYTFTAGDAGGHTFNATLKTAGVRSISATDVATASLSGSQTNITVTPAAAANVGVAGFPSPTTAGVAHSITVTLRDAFGNVATGYTGTIHFTSTDSQASRPADYAFTAGDAGIHSFNATLKTAGAQAITATDTANASLTGSQSGIAVTAAAASTLTATAFASPTTAGVAHSITVTLRDAFGNLATAYTGTVRITSSDAQASLPANYTFTAADAGLHTFTVILKTAGTQSITVADQGNAALSSTQTGIAVTAATAAMFSVTGFPASTTAGVAQTFVVTARDAYGNVATSYTGAVHFTSSDAQAGLPADYTFKAADAGVHSFTATLKTAGTRSITATDKTTSTITGSQSGISVSAATATHFAISAPATVGSQVNFSIVVTALDAFGNVATGYRGKIHFTSSDNHANLPADYTFTSTDAGVHTFTVSLKAPGNRSITVKDTATSSITGTTNVTVQ